MLHLILTDSFAVVKLIRINSWKQGEYRRMDFLGLVTDVGFPIAAACARGFFIFLTLRFILDGVLDDIKQQRIFVMALDNRVKTMNNEIIRIDVQLSNAFDLEPDLSRIARADGQKDARKD